jgi:hypothetical protein
MGRVAASRGAEPVARVTLRVTSRCNNSCVFCPIQETSRSRPDEPFDALCSALPKGTPFSAALVGGEPTIVDDLPEAIRKLKEAGADRVLVQTNGRRLAYRGYLLSLREAGLDGLDVSLHGPRADVHEYHTRVPGSFAQTLSGLRSAAAAGIDVGVTCVVTRSNHRHLAEMVRLLSSIRVRALHLALARGVGRAVAGFPSIAPRLSLAASQVGSAAELGLRSGVTVATSGLPPCLLERRFVLGIDEMPGVQGEPCAACAQRISCPGIDPSYADRYGFAELEPLRTVLACREDPRARCFLGLSPPAEG